jgi:glycyl-tRNA synthetase beta chain
MSHTLLFELGTEELPPSELPVVLGVLADSPKRLCDEARLATGSVRVFSTPRRLAVVVSGIAEHQAAEIRTVTGPPKQAAFDASGRPTKAAEGFARSQGVPIEALLTIQTDRGEYLAVERRDAGRPAAEVLPDLLQRLVASLPFAKQMRWGQGDVRFSRPVRWVVALLDGRLLPVTVAGVRAGRITYGHRFLRPEPIELATADADDYVKKLGEAFVMAEVAARELHIRQAVAAAAQQGCRPVLDDGTVETVVHLVEWPEPIVGTFAAEYVSLLPYEVIEAPIRRHQKCFVVRGGSHDGLEPFFVAVSNMPGIDPSEIRRGYERVIQARLADAAFYFREDLKTTPGGRVPLLGRMIFQERLGTLREKTDRLVALGEYLGRHLDRHQVEVLRRAARLAKSDLASGMVREFPELEGIIGGTYALRAGEAPAVADAIAQHYRPRSAEDGLPTSIEAAVLSIADKLDTIAGCIGVGLLPTGSQDPYALRRQAHGVVQLALAHGDAIHFSLGDALDRAIELLAGKLTEPAEITRDRVLELVRVRLAGILTGGGNRPDVVDAVLASGFDRPREVVRRVEALQALMRRPDWEPLVVTFKRTINILPGGFDARVDPARFVHDAERRLHEATGQVLAAVSDALGTGAYEAALSRIAALRPVVDAFFDAVMVMDNDPAIRSNRLALLKVLRDLLLPIGDLRKIQAGGSA